MSTFIRRFQLGGRGPTVGVKDTIDVAGVPTTAASRALADAAPAAAHAEVVERLLAAGYHLVGKTNLHELAFGMTGVNGWTGTPLNPRFPDFIPGGSSSGSAAAVAAGECDVALGTDTGGSIRVPAACCGVWGFKPTWGRVSRRGVMPARSSLDCVGPMAATAEPMIACLQAITPDFGSLPSLAGLRVGRLDVPARGELDAAVDKAVQSLGFPVGRVSVPYFEAAYQAGLVVINAETWAACGGLLASGRVGADVAVRLKAAAATTVEAVAQAEQVRHDFTAAVDALLASWPILALPTLADIPPRIGEPLDTSRLVSLSSLVRPFNLSGHPAVAIPLPGPVPASLQLVAAKGADELLCAVARQFVLLQ